jgi:alpha-tubulin suppressor-like RCC1 family protein
MKKIKLQFIILISLANAALGQGTWKSVSAGAGFSVALHSDGTLWSWGVNNHAQLGIGTAEINGPEACRNTPVQVLTPYHDWVAIDCGEAYTLAIRSNGTIWGWGRKKLQTIGTHILVSEPEQIGIDSNFVSISAGYDFWGAIKADGTLWTWGKNGVLLGRNDTTQWVPLPTQVGTDTTWKQISFGTCHSLGLKNNGNLFFWGLISWGVNYGDIQYTPIQIGTNTYRNISAGNGISAAIKTNGTLWVWGFNYSGQLGFGDTNDRLTPTKIGTDSDWLKIYAGSSYFIGIKNDHRLWAWGYNGDGQMGNGTMDNITYPSLISLANAKYDQVAVPGGPCLPEGGSLPFGYHTLCITENKLNICSAGANYWGYLGTGYYDNLAYFDCDVFSLASQAEENEVALSIEPNPSEGIFHVTSSSSEPMHITMLDQQGKQVAQFQLNEPTSDNSFDLSEQAPGVYFAHVTQGVQQWVKKLVVR